MAAIDHSAYAAASSFGGVFGNFRAAVAGAARRARVELAYRQTLSSLNTLSARQLADIGIDANNVSTTAYQMAQRTTR